MKKSTLATICGALCEIGFVEKTALGVYALGPELLGLATQRLMRNTLQGLAEAAVARVVRDAGEHAVVAVLRGTKVEYLAKAYPDASVVVNSDRVDTDAIYATASGRVLLAHAEAEPCDALCRELGRPDADWPEAAASRGGIDAELARIRDGGTASRTTPDGQALSMAVPVIVGERGCVAAIGVAMPVSRAGRKHCGRVLEVLHAAADEMAIGLAGRLPAAAQVGPRPANR